MENLDPRKIVTSADMARLLLQYAETVGMDMGVLEGAAGINRFDLGCRIPLSIFHRIWDIIQKNTDDPDFGLHLGEAFAGFSEGHILFSVMRNSPTIEAALNKFFRYHSLMADILRPRMVYRPQKVILLLERVYPELPINRHHVEATLAMLASTLKRLSNSCIVPLEVDFQHPHPKQVAEHSRIFSAPLRFGQNRDAFAVSKEDITRPILMANPDFLDAHEKLARTLMKQIGTPETFADKTRHAIQQAMSHGDPALLEIISRKLALSKRSLQDRLKNEGTGFRKLLDEARRKLAGIYLKDTDTSVCDVAFLLGFSDQSAFNHAFKRWNGVSPRQYREQPTND